MNLADYQVALAGAVMGGGGDAVPRSAGLAATAKVRRSWCEARAAKAARLTLSMLHSELRADLIAGWVDQGGGAAAFHTLEAETFLPFIARRLTNPSHALAVCRLDAALARATAARAGFAPAADQSGRLGRGDGASLVMLTAQPEWLLSAVLGQASAPPLTRQRFPVLAAPGITGLLRPASSGEVVLWRRLAQPAARSALGGGAGIDRLLSEGVLDILAA